jgi:hypothetical protein
MTNLILVVFLYLIAFLLFLIFLCLRSINNNIVKLNTFLILQTNRIAQAMYTNNQKRHNNDN